MRLEDDWSLRSVLLAGWASAGSIKRKATFKVLNEGTIVSWIKRLGVQRGQIVEITANSSNNVGSKIFRIVPSWSGNDLHADSIGFEYEDRLKLGVKNAGSKILLFVEKASWHSWTNYLYDHPDPIVKIQYRCTVSLAALTIQRSTHLQFLFSQDLLRSCR